MKIKDLTIRVAKTINLGNFNSIRVEAECTAALAAGDDLKSATFCLNDELTEAIAATYRRQIKEALG